MKIGLTGSIACGKSTVSAYLRQLGYYVADADAISHALTAPGGKALPALRDAFGEAIFCGETLDRRALGSIVFSDPAARAKLNALLHPLIIKEVEAQLNAHDSSDTFVFGDIPLLYECGMAHMFDRIWVVSVPRDIQIARICERDGLSREDAAKRIASQMPLHEKEALADAVVHTGGTLEDTQAIIRSHLSALQSRRPQ